MNLFHEAKKVLDKDGKVNPLGPYGKMKLTGQEVANYFRKNKVSDAKVKKAVEVALDMSGADTIARQEIKKFYGDKILKSKEVQNALQYANEETIIERMKMKDIFKKHKRELTKAYKSGDLSFMSPAARKAEDDLMQWAMDNGEVKTDDPDDFFDWLSRDLEDIVKGKIKEDVKEGYFQMEMEDDDYYPNAEKMYVDIIKKAGGRNIKVYEPSRMDPQLGIDFKGGNISRMRKELDKVGDGTETIDENYRKLAKHGMGTETPKSIKVGTEIDYYQKDGAKYMGKVTKMSRQSYTVRDDKTKKDHEFFYHDRIKAAKLLKQGDNISENADMVLHVDDKLQASLVVKMANKFGLKSKKTKISWSGKDGVVVSGDSGKLKKFMSSVEDVFKEETISEKVEYVEYKFRNKRDAQKALDYFKSQQLIKLDINDDGLSQYELAIDAGKKDMTKQHKEILKMLKPKVLTTEAVSPAQQAAIAIDRKEKRSKGAYKNVMDSYRTMWEDGQKYAPQLDEEVSNITVDPRNKISKPADQNKHAMEIAKQAKRFGLKSSMMGKHVRLKGGKKAVNDFLRVVIGKSSYGDPTEKDTSTPQIDKILTKGLK